MNGSIQSPTAKGRGCGTLFFGAFAAAGLFFTALLGIHFWMDVRTNFWTATPCTILTNELQEKNGRYHLNVTYHYVFREREFTGSKLRQSGNEFDNAADAQRAAREFRGDQPSTCYVNRKAPEESVLLPKTPWLLVAILFPLLFAAIGVIGMVSVWKRESVPRRARSETHRSRRSNATTLRVFGLIFVLAGSGIAYFFTIGPRLAVRASAGWQETPCTIIYSKVESHRGSKGGRTYSIDIRYRYTWEGESLIGDRYNFDTSSSSGYDWREEIVRQLPPGKQTVCYVNPNDPVDAVLVRDTTIMGGLVLGAFFVLVGVVLILSAPKTSAGGAKSKSLSSARGSANSLRGTSAPNGSTTLRSSSSHLGAFIFLLLFALIWNGIVWGIFATANARGGGKWFLAIFAVVGLLILALALHQFLALFNPRPILQASSGSVRLGESIEVRFQFTGRVQRIERLTLKLQGKEVATYRRGTDTKTDNSVFAEITLLETNERARMQSGTVTVAVPTNSMHSFDAPNNKIVWALHLHGSIPRWPDVSEEFEINVLPHAFSAPESSAV